MWLAFGSQTRELRDGELVVGSGADADWRISTADLMPRHFTITIYGLNASLRATARDNVVAVNDQQLVGVPRLLNDGDLIAAGAGRFLYSEGTARADTLPPARSGPAYLVSASNGSGRELSSRSTMLGRDASSTIMIDDAAVSRFHAEVRREAGGFALHSLGSAGTLVNGRRMAMPVMLREGDVVDIAGHRWRFTATPPAEHAAGPADNPLDRPWQVRAAPTGTIDVVHETPRAARRGLLVAAALVAAAIVVILLVLGRGA